MREHAAALPVGLALALRDDTERNVLFADVCECVRHVESVTGPFKTVDLERIFALCVLEDEEEKEEDSCELELEEAAANTAIVVRTGSTGGPQGVHRGPRLHSAAIQDLLLVCYYY